ncbi:MAG: hypothetical protein AAGF99_10180 [Bacteroidota bacterium]
MDPATYIAPEAEMTTTNCDREPIHIPGTVQAHGAVLVTDANGVVVQVTANAEDVVGVPAPQALGHDCTTLFAEADAVRLQQTLASDADWEDLNPLVLETRGGARVNVIGHRQDAGTVLELEPGEDAAWYPEPQPVQRALRALRAADSVDALQEAIVEEVRRLTGFGRVMLYRFDPSWNGAVVAETAREGIGSFLGLRFPASDIPAQARALYARNRLRLIPTV